MSYEKQTWEDRQVERPLTFTQQINSDGSVTLTPYPGSVLSEGSKMSADRFNHMEDGIYDNSTRIEEVNENISTYSTQEEKTGGKWIDGKDIYRKTFYVETPVFDSSNRFSFNHDIENYEKFTKIDGNIYDTVNANQYPLPYATTGTANIMLYTSSTQIILEQKPYGASRLKNLYVIMEYVKTS